MVLRLSTTKLDEWAAYYRIQAKEREKDQQNAEAQAARARAEAQLSRDPG